MKLITLLYLSTTITAFAQQIRIPDVSGSYVDRVYPFYNTASITEISGDGNLFFGHKQGLSTFSIFKQNYFNANFIIGSDSANKHGVGLKVINDYAGKYIASNRVSLLYSNSIKLRNNTRLSLGVAPTLISYTKEAQSFGGKDNTGNLDVGLWLNTRTFDLGLSANQLIPSTLVVIDEIDSIRSYYVFNLNYKLKMNQSIDFQLQSFYMINKSLPNLPVVGLSFCFRNKFKAAINYELNRNVVFVLGVEQLQVPQMSGSLEIDVVVSTPSVSNIYRPKNGLEWLISYNF